MDIYSYSTPEMIYKALENPGTEYRDEITGAIYMANEEGLIVNSCGNSMSLNFFLGKGSVWKRVAYEVGMPEALTQWSNGKNVIVVIDNEHIPLRVITREMIKHGKWYAFEKGGNKDESKTNQTKI